MVYTVSAVVDEAEREERAEFEKRAGEAMGNRDREAEPKPDDGMTVAELAGYVASAGDTGGSVYCATKTWYGSGLSDAFERLAERLSPAERRAAEQNMRAALPPCRDCGCQQTELKSVA
jgi:hypothetical protein